MAEPLPRRRSRRALPTALLTLGLVVGGPLASACSKGDDPGTPAKAAGTTAGTVVPGTLDTFPPPTGTAAPTVPVGDVALPGPPFTTVTPKAAGQLAVYDAPNGTASRTLPNPRLINNDPNAKVPLTLLQKADAGNGWLEVYLPVRPNGSTGFVKASDVTAARHDYHIEVHLDAFDLKVFNGDKVVLDAPIAVAADNTPTPGGLYYTTELIRPPDPNGPYGSYAYGLSGFSDTLQTFNGGPGQLGIHGTNEPGKIGQKVSHGCIRLRNADIEKLVPILPLGVPVAVYA